MKPRKIVWSVVVFLTLVGLALIAPYRNMGALYEALDAPAEKIWLNPSEVSVRGESFVRDGTIFIKKETRYSALVLVTYLHAAQWSEEDLRVLRARREQTMQK